MADPHGYNAIAAILKGVDVKTASGAIHMPAFGSALSNAETAALVRYLIHVPSGEKAKITASRIGKYRE